MILHNTRAPLTPNATNWLLRGLDSPLPLDTRAQRSLGTALACRGLAVHLRDAQYLVLTDAGRILARTIATQSKPTQPQGTP